MRSAEELIAPFHLAQGAPVVLAVSGGVDSMVLMHLLSTLPPARLSLTVATFDHQLRPSSAAEQQMVIAAATALGLPVRAGRWPRADQPQSGLEAAARSARYTFLKEVASASAARVIMTAHHADDQLETVLFRLARSGRLPAMVGMRPQRQWGELTVIRPLLALSKQSLIAYAKAHALTYCEDESNRDLRFARNRLRHDAVPALKAVNPGVLAHTARFSSDLAAVLTLADRQLRAMLPQDASEALDWTALTQEAPAVQALLLDTALDRWQVRVSPRVRSQVLSALNARQGTKRFAAASGRILIAAYGQLTVADSSPAALPAVLLSAAGRWYRVGQLTIGRFDRLPSGATFLAAVPDQPLTVRTRRPHDELQLADGHHQLLRRFFINQKIPQPERETRLVAALGDQVYWVQGIAPRQLFAGSQTDILQAVLALKSEAKDETTHE
ncbi:tRNA lysidine(34) synthetase TilS [Lacticaseibacillus jixianensis]|uniref:tRNA(Ile)-lysidine synthase n=1 Tax=Lacticaseibacillus jixianensis TaxID=2486012 RepID=A0ABW4B9T4_9LACO|nr:tRNA lysidine(34) synthetase TilS [Lacticaseibacillus jixianensis]